MSILHKVSPWTAQPLKAAAVEAKHRRLLDLKAESVLLGRSALLAGWIVGGVGASAFIASIAGWMVMLPLKTIEQKVVEVDTSTGAISEMSNLADAPKLYFGAASDQQYLRRYLEAREGWVWELDARNDHIAKIMSSPDEQARIAADRARPDSNVRTLGKDGYVILAKFHYHMQGTSKDGVTRSYQVFYERTVWHGNVADKPQYWTAFIDFQWHPLLDMARDDRTINTGGFVVIAYSAANDERKQ